MNLCLNFVSGNVYLLLMFVVLLHDDAGYV
jgi:hypothetical protein